MLKLTGDPAWALPGERARFLLPARVAFFPTLRHILAQKLIMPAVSAAGLGFRAILESATW